MLPDRADHPSKTCLGCYVSETVLNLVMGRAGEEAWVFTETQNTSDDEG